MSLFPHEATFDLAWVSRQVQASSAAIFPVLLVNDVTTAGRQAQTSGNLRFLAREVSAVVEFFGGETISIADDRVIAVWGMRTPQTADPHLAVRAANKIAEVVGANQPVRIVCDLWEPLGDGSDPITQINACLKLASAAAPPKTTSEGSTDRDPTPAGNIHIGGRMQAALQANPTSPLSQSANISRAKHQQTGPQHPLTQALCEHIQTQIAGATPQAAALIMRSAHQRRQITAQLERCTAQAGVAAATVELSPSAIDRPNDLARRLIFEIVTSHPVRSDGLLRLNAHGLGPGHGDLARYHTRLLTSPDLDLIRRKIDRRNTTLLARMVIAHTQQRPLALIFSEIGRAGAQSTKFLRSLITLLLPEPKIAVILSSSDATTVRRLAPEFQIFQQTPSASDIRSSMQLPAQTGAKRPDAAASSQDDFGGLRPYALSASVFRKRIDAELLALALEMPTERLLRGLNGLASSGVLRKSESASADTFEFVSQREHERLRGEIDETRARELHKRLAKHVNETAAKAPSADVMADAAWHKENAGDLSEAIAWWRKAALAAAREDNAKDARTFNKRALRICANRDDPESRQAQVAIVSALAELSAANKGTAHISVEAALRWCLRKSGYELGKTGPALAAAQAPAQSCTTAPHTAFGNGTISQKDGVSLLVRLHDACRMRGDYRSTEGIERLLTQMTGDAADEELRAAMSRVRTLNAFQRGDLRKAADAVDLTLEAFNRLRAQRRLSPSEQSQRAHVLSFAAYTAALQGDHHLADEDARAAMMDAERARNSSIRANVLCILAGQALCTDREIDAAAYANAARSIAQQYKMRHWDAVANVFIGYATARMEPARGLAIIRNAIARYEGLGARQFLPVAHLLAARAALRNAETEIALGEIELAHDVSLQTGIATHLGEIMRVEAESLVLSKKPSQCGRNPIAVLRDAYKLAQRQGAVTYVARIAKTYKQVTGESIAQLRQPLA